MSQNVAGDVDSRVALVGLASPDRHCKMRCGQMSGVTQSGRLSRSKSVKPAKQKDYDVAVSY